MRPRHLADGSSTTLQPGSSVLIVVFVRGKLADVTPRHRTRYQDALRRLRCHDGHGPAI